MNSPLSNHALLAGVCSRLAHTLHWNVWVIRVLFVLLLLVKTLPSVLGYAALALIFHYFDRHRDDGNTRQSRAAVQSPELAARQRKIDDLERRFRAWEESLKN